MTHLPPLALSIRQPWGWAIIHAGKDIENRDWSTRFRGPVCVHVSKGMTRSEYLGACDFIVGTMQVRPLPPTPEDLQRGGIVGVVDVVDCVEASDSPWFFGRYGFVLANPRPVPFIACRGMLGFFKWSVP